VGIKGLSKRLRPTSVKACLSPIFLDQKRRRVFCKGGVFYSVFLFHFQNGEDKISDSKISAPTAGFSNALMKHVVGFK